MAIRVVPDGAVFDRVAEFVFGKQSQSKILYRHDEGGYTDALFKFVQGLASADTLVWGDLAALTEESAKLKRALIDLGWSESSSLFATPDLPSVRTSALQWLGLKWDRILDQIGRPLSLPSAALAGHVNRECFYAFNLKHPNWQRTRWDHEGATMRVPPVVLARLVQQVIGHRELGVAVDPAELSEWIEHNVVSHYRIYGEYLLNLQAEYLPGWTRTSLGITADEGKSDIKNVAMPFVALRAIEQVKRREELLDKVVEWKRGAGRLIVDKIGEMQHTLRSVTDQQVRDRQLSDIQTALHSGLPVIALMFVKNLLGGGEGRLSVAQSMGEFRWLWQIRAPELKTEWQKRVKELAP